MMKYRSFDRKFDWYADLRLSPILMLNFYLSYAMNIRTPNGAEYN